VHEENENMAEFTEYKPGTPSWVDLQTADVDKGTEFYTKLFGWETQDLGPEAGGYRFFTKSGKLVAGAGPKMMDEAPSNWMTYVAVTDADSVAAKVKDKGGKVLAEPMDVMTAGRMGVFADTTGAVFGVWQARDHKGAQVANEPNSWSWNELQTRDAGAAKAFYKDVIGWEPTAFEGMDYTIFNVDGKSVAGCMEMGDQIPKDVPPHWLSYFEVADADATVAKAKELGATVFMEPTDIPKVGRFAVVADPQGAVFGVIKSEMPPAG
jgi:uncharacterized protein